MRIEPACDSDVPTLVALLAGLFALEADFEPDAVRQARGLGMLLARPAHAVILVARSADHGAVGMVTAQLVVSSAEGALSAWIEDVVVRPDHRGRGIGRALIDAVLEWSRGRGATRAQLLADRSNVPALAFYRRLGWSPTRLDAHRIFLHR